MTADAIVIVQTLFGSIWTLTTSWNIPGTHMSPAEWAFFSLTLIAVLRFVKRVFSDVHGSGNSEKE